MNGVYESGWHEFIAFPSEYYKRHYPEHLKKHRAAMQPNPEPALNIPCPTCGVAEDVACVYVWPKGVTECEFWEDSEICYKHTDTQHERLTKVGTPTKAPHQSRKIAVHKRKIRERQLEEWEQLRRWLLKYGDIFKEG